MSRLIVFYRGEKPDHAGRTVEEIWGFSFDELESKHDFIQWLFPIDTRSPVNPLAPVLIEEAAAVFRSDPKLQERVRKSLAIMLRFYGFEKRETPHGITIVRGPDFEERAPGWLSFGNHNHQRLTRIIRCLHLCGLDADARALVEVLTSLAGERPRLVDAVSVRYWQDAVR